LESFPCIEFDLDLVAFHCNTTKDYLEKFAHDLGAISIVSENGFDQLITAYLFTVDDYKLCVEDMKKTTEGMVRFLYVMKKTGNIIENSINNWVVAEE
jgi:hypothetical protein